MEPETQPTPENAPASQPQDPAPEPAAQAGAAPDEAKATEPEAAPEAKPEPPKYRVIGRETTYLAIPLTLEERASLGDKIGEVGRAYRELERHHEEACTEASRLAKDRKKDIADKKGALDNLLEAQQTGVERRGFECERRAVVASATIELVRLDNGDVIESRPMSGKEQEKWCRQGDITDATGGATIPVDPTGAESQPSAIEPESDERLTEPGKRCVGWPVAWMAAGWSRLVQVESGDVALEEPHVWEVYVQTPSEGEGITGGAVAKATGYQLQCAVRALELLVGKGFAKKVGRRWWSVMPGATGEVPAEGGRKDSLPEAGDITRPRLTEPATKADALLADAGETSRDFVVAIPGA